MPRKYRGITHIQQNINKDYFCSNLGHSPCGADRGTEAKVYLHGGKFRRHFAGREGRVFAKILEHAGVYQRNEQGKTAFLRFVDQVNRS